MFNYLKKHNMRNSLKMLLCLTAICVFSNNAAAKICFLPDGDCGKTKITDVNSGKNGCIYKTKGEADAGKNDECEVSYQSQVNSCWWRRCNSDNKTIFDKLADCQKKIEDATKQECQACGSCYKLVTSTTPLPDNCPSGYSTKYQSPSDCGANESFSENGTYNGKVCGACIPAKTCPTGYSTQYQSQKDCQSGETFSSSGMINDKVCGKCEKDTRCQDYTLTAAKDSNCYSCSTCPTDSSKYKCTESVKTGYQLVNGVCKKEDSSTNAISITALSCSVIDETPSYRDIQTLYSFIYSPNQQQSLNAYVFTKDLISGETDDNDIGIYTTDDIDIDNLTYSSGCPGGGISIYSRYYKKDYEDNGETYKAGEYSRRENIADVKFFIGGDNGNLINTQQKVPFPFYDIDNTPTKSAEFTYNNQKYIITAVKKEVSNTNTCDDGYSSEKPYDNIFYYTQKGNCYKATGCIENGIVSATSATGCVGTPQCVTPTEITHTAQTCYINWPSDIEFFLAWDKIAEYTSGGRYQWVIGNGYVSEDEQTAGYWKRVKGVYDSLHEPSSRYYKIKTKDVKNFFYLKKIKVYDKENQLEAGAPIFAAYWRISPTNSCQSGSLDYISYPDSIRDFGDQNQILPVIHPMTGDKWNSYTSSNDTWNTGFCTENENSLSKSIYLKGDVKTILYDYTKHDVTVCFKYNKIGENELCKDIQMRMYINK